MDITTTQMIALLRCSLNGHNPEPLPCSTEEWEKLYWLARKHGVVTMINDIIEKLPPDRQPQGDIALSWPLSADRTRYHYARQAEVLEKLRQKASAQGLRILVLKGIGLSRLYPVPSSRACGDIDLLFLPLSRQSFDAGNRLLGINDNKVHGKHTETIIDGVPVENHLTFLDLNYASQKSAEQYIRSSLSDVTSEGFLPPMADMVYLLMHTVSHFTAQFKLPLRNILDWGMFLQANRKVLSPQECHHVMRQIGMTDAFNMLTQMAGEFIGTDLSDFISKPIRRRDADRMRGLILDKKHIEYIPKGLSPIQRFMTRISRNNHNRWLYRYLPSSRRERIKKNYRHLIRKIKHRRKIDTNH